MVDCEVLAASAQRRRMATVEEALPLDRHPASQPEAFNELAGPGHRARQVDQDPAGLRMPPQQRGQHGTGPASDIDDGADSVPAVAELDVVVGDAVPGRSHERVELRPDRRVDGQVLPEGPAEDLLVGG